MIAGTWRWAVLGALAVGVSPTVHAKTATGSGPAPAGNTDPTADDDRTADDEADDADAQTASGYTPPAAAVEPAFQISGYVDVGFADAQGNGTSFPRADLRLPADYGVDAFAPAVNGRGDVASADPGGRFVNGFLPRSTNIGGHPSFLLNVMNLDLRYQSRQAPLLIFARIQLLPRWDGRGAGDQTHVYLEQAFGRLAPLEGREVFLFIGRFDSAFGIEYLDNPSPIRTGVTPSLFARYTTGQSVGAKLFSRIQVAPLWSALSLNVSATNSGAMIEALQPPDASLTGVPVLSGRLGYELNLRWAQVKLGGSGLRGPRNDQFDRHAMQTMWGADARLYAFGLSLSGEYVHVDEEAGSADKQTGIGGYALSSEFLARGYWAQAAYTLGLGWGALRAVTPYGRFEHRHARFEGFRPVTVERITAGLRVDLWQHTIAKAEYLWNDEIAGAPRVRNNVFTAAVVQQW